jgi:hypothetical protein
MTPAIYLLLLVLPLLLSLALLNKTKAEINEIKTTKLSSHYHQDRSITSLLVIIN